MESIKRFSYVSVRDSWTQGMIDYLSSSTVMPDITPDPVFAFNYNAGYLLPKKTEILEKFNLPEKYVLSSFKGIYSISKKWMKEFKSVLNKNSYKLVGLPMPQGLNDLGFNSNISLPISPLEWYSIIKYSSGYIGHNMHPIIVAIHNHVPFFSFDYYGILKYKKFVNLKASKIYDLLSTTELRNSMFSLLKPSKKIISPNMVYDRITGIDTEIFTKFNELKIRQYSKMMEKIIKSFV